MVTTEYAYPKKLDQQGVVAIQPTLVDAKIVAVKRSVYRAFCEQRFRAILKDNAPQKLQHEEKYKRKKNTFP